MAWPRPIGAEAISWHRPVVHSRWIAATLLATACQAPPSSAAIRETPAAAQPSSATEVEPAPPPTPASPRKPPHLSGFVGTGALWLLFDDRIVRYDTSGFETIAAPDGELRDLFEGPDGKPYVRDANALYDIEADTLHERWRFDGPVHHLALGPDLRAWVSTDKGLGVPTEHGWSFTPLDRLELDTSTRLAFDHDGTAWAVDETHALYFEANRWIASQVSLLGPNLHFGHALGSPVGRVHVTNHHLMTRLGKGDFDSIVFDPEHEMDYGADLDIAPDGYACVATSSCDVACTNAVPPTILWRFACHRYSCKSVEAIAVDADHRVWVASPSHLSLLEPNAPDRKARETPREQLPALAGVVRNMIVVD